MTPVTAAPEKLLTAEEFMRLPDDGIPKELVRGRVVRMPVPFPSHGYYCANIAGALWAFVKQNRLGRVMSNDSAVQTERDPDTVRGGDVCYYSYARVPEGELPGGLLEAMPELVVEVRSPSDRWAAMHRKVGEYTYAGVDFVCVVDPPTVSVHVYSADHATRIFEQDETLELPEILPGFRMPVREIFE